MSKAGIGDGVVSDGGGIKSNGTRDPDLVIALVDKTNTVCATYPGVGAECLESSDTDATIRFSGSVVSAGNYTVYAVANTAGLWLMNSTVGACTTKAQLDALVFNALADGVSPTVSASAMPLSAIGSLEVNESLNGEVTLELLRCVSKVNIIFKNETGEDLTLYDCTVTIHGINPNQGYLFPHDPDAAGTPRDLEIVNDELSVPRTTPFTANLSPNDVLVFPSVAPSQSLGSRYLCDISFKTEDGGEELSFVGLPVHDKMSMDIPALKRNQYLKIETRINKGNQITFNFEVLNWVYRQEEIVFH